MQGAAKTTSEWPLRGESYQRGLEACQRRLHHSSGWSAYGRKRADRARGGARCRHVARSDGIARPHQVGGLSGTHRRTAHVPAHTSCPNPQGDPHVERQHDNRAGTIEFGIRVDALRRRAFVAAPYGCSLSMALSPMLMWPSAKARCCFGPTHLAGISPDRYRSFKECQCTRGT